MNLQSFAPDAKKPDTHLEALEARSLTPERAAKETLRQADRLLTDQKSQLEALKMTLGAQAPERAQIQQLEDEIDAAWEDLSTEVNAAVADKPDQAIATEEELDWEMPEAPSSTEAAQVKEASPTKTTKEELDSNIPLQQEIDPLILKNILFEKLPEIFRGTSSIEEIRSFLSHEKARDALQSYTSEVFYTDLVQAKIDFSKLRRAISVFSQNPEHLQLARQELQDFIGPKYAEQILSDPAYLTSLEKLQNILSQPISEGGPKLASHSDIPKLILAHDLFGEDFGSIARGIDLHSYNTEIQYATNGKGPVAFIGDPQFDDETGECVGDIILSLTYAGSSNGDPPRIDRTYHKSTRKDLDGTVHFEKTVDLNLIRIPDHIKSQNTAKNEMKMTENLLREKGFDSQALHANIDVGGYAWATMGFGWDIEKMRGDEKNKPAEQVIQDFALKRIDHVKDLLLSSDIPLETPAVAALLKKLETALTESPLAVTPQYLANLGKSDGPKYIKASSGRFYEESVYPQYSADDPPDEAFKGAMHLGKILLIESDWYGKKALTKTE